jgi:hypothetical protein
MAGSAYAVAKARLVTKLDAHATLTSKVTYGDAEANGARELVMVLASPGEADEIWATIGNQARDEEFDIVVLCEVVRPGDSQQEATERCETLFAAVETQVRDWLNTRTSPDQTAATAGITGAQIVRVRRDEFPEPEGRGASTTAVVRISARKKP